MLLGKGLVVCPTCYQSPEDVIKDLNCFDCLAPHYLCKCDGT